jgi:hypothetical protein
VGPTLRPPVLLEHVVLDQPGDGWSQSNTKWSQILGLRLGKMRGAYS